MTHFCTDGARNDEKVGAERTGERRCRGFEEADLQVKEGERYTDR